MLSVGAEYASGYGRTIYGDCHGGRTSAVHKRVGARRTSEAIPALSLLTQIRGTSRIRDSALASGNILHRGSWCFIEYQTSDAPRG